MIPSNHVVIVAGGSGTRMGTDTPKQFLKINGKPILMHTIEKFLFISPQPNIVLVLPQNQIKIWEKLCEEHSFFHNIDIVVGGNTRFQSVKNGLSKIPPNNSLVAIHDGVRPFVSVDVITRCFQTAEIHESAIPVIKPVESVRIIDNGSSKPFDRNNVFLVQTPQVFKSKLIKECYSKPEQNFFTDDASVFEYYGYQVTTLEGNRENIKITTPFDLLIANALINKKQNS
ncbi:MAG: 2-C-methyl-D-erythritol 4-phosphate cytidylyltransferase [Tenuifilum sp.]|jgi:2-C-methyl-D-erythritol 4-phosphate cytidylyltransferase|uniref:2-C-methyl-D-erythritol 4-phosphate cytidylyltransferase n=1 Tax=Tenuifilum sp. TaxID=2760880 RepID=UPI0024AA583F|nr:2-C-methyl-D-erythritol 4-phosphate cytidylyltransferase [Tenuifilum sp.]MDI3526831.1 2-C-methyl-D-erythritol 4-phosphate cytidylyltransferase [Tenuifilum sp.]